VQATVTDLRERNRVDSRAPTVDAAFVLFAERGYCHVTVAGICAAAGTGRRPSFQYFATKDDVLNRPAREMTARFTAAITPAPADTSDRHNRRPGPFPGLAAAAQEA
jgi:AcrR family transcriptional regulator